MVPSISLTESPSLEWNVFDNILGNYTYISVLVLTMILQVILVLFGLQKKKNPMLFLQVLLVEFGGDAVKTTPLDLEQWLWCVGLGACSLPIGAQ